MKRFKLASIAILLLTVSSTTFAVRNGPYLGLQLGESNSQNKSELVITSPVTVEQISPSNSGFAGRIFGGYNFNQYAAWEIGYAYYAASSYKVSGGTGNNPAIRQNAVDLVAKGIFPFSDTGFDIFGKAGIAVVHSSTSATVLTSQNTNGHGATINKALPTLGVGVSYDITQNWVADFSANQIFGSGDVKSITFIAFGISYHIVDQYCGQFLC